MIKNESKVDGELWFLVDAQSIDQARQIVTDSDDNSFELSACVEVTTNSDIGISHKFTLIEEKG